MKQYESDIVLRDGSLAFVRPATPDDHALLLEFLRKLTRDSINLRFHHSIDPHKEVAALIPTGNQFALIACRNEAVIGHAIYTTTVHARAEIAVIVLDEFQDKGLGTILLGQLAQAAADAGIAFFEAKVLPENARLLQVVSKLGFPTNLRSDPGFVHVTFPASKLPEALAFFEEQETESAIAAMKKFLKPRGIAVIGASTKRGGLSGELFRNILETSFNGPVYPVNARSDVVQSVAAYRSVLDCPGQVDLAFIVVPAKAVLSVARECAQKGVSALVVISSGFAETNEEGAQLQKELVALCQRTGMRLIGPNCMGIINTDPAVNLNGQFAPYKPIPGQMGFLSQSGALGVAIIEYASRLGLGMSSFISVGNKADISGNDLIQYWEQDEHTNLILLYLESFGNPRKFSKIARRVSKKKPILAVKGGRSKAGFRATQSHTGALISTSNITVDALFQQAGVIRVDTLEEMFDVAALLNTQPIPSGNRVGIITNAGGAGILAADACENLGMIVPEFSLETQQRLRSQLSPAAAIKNPVDMVASASAEDFSKTILSVASDANIDALIVIFIKPMAITAEAVAEQILSATKELNGRLPVLTSFMAYHGKLEILGQDEIEIPSYPFPESAARALSKAVEYGKWLNKSDSPLFSYAQARKEEAKAIIANALVEGECWLSSPDVQRLLDCYGISLVETRQVTSPAEAAQAASDLGGKIALKALAPGLVHKTEAGGVRLGLSGFAETQFAAQQMLDQLESDGFHASGFLVQPMIPEGLEMLVGVTHDPVFGPILVCGTGGVLVELLNDIAVRIAPINVQDAHEMLTSLKTYPLLNGYRGGPVYDTAALEQIIDRISSLVEDISEIKELDLNPVIVLTKGVAIVDARIRVAQGVPTHLFGSKKH